MNGEARYGKKQLKKGLKHFLFGKLFSSVGGVVYLLLLVRELEIEEFATYTVLTAFVEFFTAITGFGLTHVLLRYAPELHVQELDRSLKRLVLSTTALRALTLLGCLLIAYYFGSAITTFFELNTWLWAYDLFLIVIFLRATRNMLFQSMEALLLQKHAQRALLLVTVLKLALLLILMLHNDVNLRAVIYLEIVSEIIGLLFMGYLHWIWLLRTAKGCPEKYGWLSVNRGRMFSFGMYGYMQHLAIMLYGSSPNRLLLSRHMPPAEVASFGIAQSIIDTIRRYLPAQLLSGFVRSVLLANYTKDKDFTSLTRVSDLLLRCNLLVLSMLLAPMLVVGENIFAFATGGKYATDANVVFVGLLLVLALESYRFVLDIVIQAIERNVIQVATNALLSLSLFASILMLPYFGTLAVVYANLLGLLITNLLLFAYIRRRGYPLKINLRQLLLLVGATVCAAFAGFVFEMVLEVWFATVLFVVVIHVGFLLFFRPLSVEEIRMIDAFRRNDEVRYA